MAWHNGGSWAGSNLSEDIAQILHEICTAINEREQLLGDLPYTPLGAPGWYSLCSYKIYESGSYPYGTLPDYHADVTEFTIADVTKKTLPLKSDFVTYEAHSLGTVLGEIKSATYKLTRAGQVNMVQMLDGTWENYTVSVGTIFPDAVAYNYSTGRWQNLAWWNGIKTSLESMTYAEIWDTDLSGDLTYG